MTFMDVNMHLTNGIKIYKKKKILYKKDQSGTSISNKREVCNLPYSKWLGTWRDTLTLIQLTADPYVDHKPNECRYKLNKASFPIWPVPGVNQNKHRIGSIEVILIYWLSITFYCRIHPSIPQWGRLSPKNTKIFKLGVFPRAVEAWSHWYTTLKNK